LKNDFNYTDGKSGREWKVNSSNPAERDIDNPDPIIGGSSPKMSRTDRDAYAVDLSENKIKKTALDAQLETLKEFYSSYLVRKTKRGDGYDSNNSQLYMEFEPRYYFFGLTQSAQTNNPTLMQTVGWEDYKNGGNGTFDPLVETTIK
jgi:hypothetical protein